MSASRCGGAKTSSSLPARDAIPTTSRSPGMLHMAVLRSPHAHASSSTSIYLAAQAAPGVRLVLSGADLAGKIGCDRAELDHAGHQSAGPAGGRHRSGSLCRRMRRAGGRRNPGHGARCRRTDRRRLRNASGRDRRGSRDPRRRPAAARQRAEQYHDVLQDRRRRLREGGAAKPTRSSSFASPTTG